MKKPTCKTCAYYHRWKRNRSAGADDLRARFDGECRLKPTSLPRQKNFWCGEHPHFKQWQAFEDGLLRWVLVRWEEGKVEYLQGVGEEPHHFENPTKTLKDAKHFRTEEEAVEMAESTHQHYYPESARFLPIPITLKFAGASK